MTTAAIVLVPDQEVRPTSIGLVRCLGRAGVPVATFSCRRHTPSFYSRYVVHREIACSLNHDPEKWISSLIALADSLSGRPVLFPSSDEHVWLIHQYRDELDPWVRYLFNSPDVLSSCIDKRKMYEKCRSAGIETGEVVLVPDPANAKDAIARARFPCVLKPAAWVNLSDPKSCGSRPFQQEFGSKAVSVTNPGELSLALARAAHLPVPVLLQEEIPGPASAIHHISLYADKASRIRGLFLARKRRQYPSKFGGACLIESEENAEVAALAASLVRVLGFRGIAGAIEFKRHPKTGRLYFLEINPRASASVAATMAGGANLPYLAYLDAIGTDLPDLTSGTLPVRWVCARLDVKYWLSYRRGDHTGEAIPFREYIRSLRGPREYAYWALDDPLPAIAQAMSMPRDVWRMLRTAVTL